jgi:hypothetical protein
MLRQGVMSVDGRETVRVASLAWNNVDLVVPATDLSVPGLVCSGCAAEF